MAEKYAAGTIMQPASGTSIRQVTEEHKKECISAASDALKDEQWSHLRFNLILENTWNLVRASNNHIAKTEPWKLTKTDGNAVRDVLFSVWNSLRMTSLLLYPFMPETAEKMWKQLGLGSLTDETKDSYTGSDTPGIFSWDWMPSYPVKILKGEQLFPRIEKEKEEKGPEIEKKPLEEKVEGSNLISINDVMKVQLKVGKILSAERVKKSDKLIRLQVNTGEERQIVAGIGKAYSPEDLVGKKIVVVTNLQPAKLMGVESNGMLLAATGSDGAPVILVPERDVEEGSKIK
jgi:methionyl-tRNA synthetase